MEKEILVQQLWPCDYLGMQKCVEGLQRFLRHAYKDVLNTHHSWHYFLLLS